MTSRPTIVPDLFLIIDRDFRRGFSFRGSLFAPFQLLRDVTAILTIFHQVFIHIPALFPRSVLFLYPGENKPRVGVVSTTENFTPMRDEIISRSRILQTRVVNVALRVRSQTRCVWLACTQRLMARLQPLTARRLQLTSAKFDLTSENKFHFARLN